MLKLSKPSATRHPGRSHEMAKSARSPYQYAQTQQNVSASNFVQSDPARGFHEMIWSDRRPNLAAIPSQVSPHCT